MLKKFVVASCAITLGFCFGYFGAIAHARIVPGVDEPFDPTAYYSLTEISYADSAPSVFALRELERGEVFDYTRYIKSQLFGEKFEGILGKIKEMAGIQEKDNKALPEMTVEETIRIIEQIEAKKKANKTAPDTVNGGNGKIMTLTQFNDDTTIVDAQTQFDSSEAARYYTSTLSELAETSKSTYAANEDALALVAKALEASQNAEGETQAWQANTIMENAKTLAGTQLSDLYAKLIQLKTVEGMRTESKDAMKDVVQTHSSYGIVAPDDSRLEWYKGKYGLEPSESISMPDFK